MCQFLLLPHFVKRLKKFTKKYRHLKDSLQTTLQNFQKSQAISLGNNVYKLRLSSPDISRGKNKSFRLIIYIIEIRKTIVPVTLFYKGDQSNITKKEINDHLEQILIELESVDI